MLTIEKAKQKLKKAKTVLYLDAHSNVKIPNLALMKLSYYLGLDYDYATSSTIKQLPAKKLFRDYDLIFCSCIYSYKYPSIVVQIHTKNWEGKTLIGGYGSPFDHTLEDIIGTRADIYDYSLYPWFEPNIGFSQRGCRNKCEFCVVPKHEGRNRSVNSLMQLMQKSTKKLVLLDNDFFGQKEWKEKCDFILEEDLKISFNQGINVRLLTEEQAEYLVKIKPYSYTFKSRLLNTAWDQQKDEKLFRKKIEMLLGKGFNPKHIMVYMLIGFEQQETFEDIWHRFWTIQKYGLFPYPMVYITCMSCEDQQNCDPSTNYECPRRAMAKALIQFREWVHVYAKDRFVKHNVGTTNERDYYKDWVEYFQNHSESFPKEVVDFFTHSKFKGLKVEKAAKKRIRKKVKDSMVCLWDKGE